ncbi:unnamed protein product [Urochloa decumbens]|uniref:Aluminum-activated malate transporter n=1 Tax=Urochloa decumbens TaxID=240449 RepID=A0ABC9C9L2_9POAL
MESQTESNNNNVVAEGSDDGGGFLASCRDRLCSVLESFRLSFRDFAEKLAKIARDDPRRVAHSLKFGLALTLVSVFYYVTPLFNSWGDSTIWAVITVLFVMEFTVGATLSKGINRVLATLTAGLLAVGAHLVARLCASAATFSRFIPEVKARYEYGVIIFILTFAMVTVSSYRVENLIEYAHERLTTIMVGVATCLFTNVFVFPIWAGEDLQKLAAGNLDKLAEFLEGMESDCFGENSCEKLEGRAFLQVYKSVLNSKATEDTLCTFAKWEPVHGKFRFRHPWSQYQKIGALCRQCASSMEALASYVVTSKKSQVLPEANPELSMKVGAACRAISLRSAKALRELSSAVRTTTIPSPTDDDDDMPTAVRTASDFITELSDDDAVVLQVMHVAVIASLLADIAAQTERISEAVDDLARLARFEKTERAVVVNIENS